MPWPTYSHTFLRASTTVGWRNWTVPLGYRAVVKCVAMTNDGTAGAYVQADISGSPFIVFTFRAAEWTVLLNGMWVAYGGSVLQLYIGTTNCAAMVSGYLLSDPIGEDQAPLAPSTKPSKDPPLVVPAPEA